MSLEAAKDELRSILGELRRTHVIRWRVYTVRLTIAPGVGSVDEQSVEISKSLPFVFLAIGWTSTRDYDGRIVSTTSIRTDDITFVNRPTKLNAMSGDQMQGPFFVPPARLSGGEKLYVALRRDWALNPAEAYPGVGNSSVIDVSFHGLELVAPIQGTEQR